MSGIPGRVRIILRVLHGDGCTGRVAEVQVGVSGKSKRVSLPERRRSRASQPGLSGPIPRLYR